MNDGMPMNPKVGVGQFVLIQTEVQTGIVLNTDGKRHLGQGERHLVFDKFEDADVCAKQIVRKNPAVEVVIQNSENVNVATIRDEEYVREYLRRAAKQSKRPWWKFFQA